MNAHIEADRDLCVGAGNCVLTLPTIFDQDDDGLVTLDDPDPENADPELLHRAAQLCPAGAITITTP